METHLAVISLWAEDVPATAHFYRDVLGLNLLLQAGHDPHFQLDGIYLVIKKGHPAPAQEPPFPVLALSVSDLQAMIARLEAHHVALPWGIEHNADSQWVKFSDPAGNLIEVVQFGHPQGEG